MPNQFQFNYRTFASQDALSLADQTLVSHALMAMQQAYAPYSKFKVGASVLLQSGQIVQGNNQENIAYP
ncbi:MAG: hypothetical protein ACKOGD_00790, partial [Sphingomonadales bacterium]